MSRVLIGSALTHIKEAAVDSPILSIVGLSFRFPAQEGSPEVTVLDAFSLAVPRGGRSILFGRADAGKTTRCDTEVAFALESLGLPRPEMRERVGESLRRVGL